MVQDRDTWLQDRDTWLQAFLTRHSVPGYRSLVKLSNWRQLHQKDTVQRWRLLFWHWLTSQLLNAHFVSCNTYQLKKNPYFYAWPESDNYFFIKCNKPRQSPGSQRCILFTGVRFISKATTGQVLITSSSAFNTTHLPTHSFVSGPNRSKFGRF